MYKYKFCHTYGYLCISISSVVPTGTSVIRATVGIRNQHYLYRRIPTTVAKLLQYSGSRVETQGWVFFMRSESQLTENGVSTLDLGFLKKTVGLMA